MKVLKGEMANPNLPQDTLIQIFSILPAKSVGRCRCLSKTWSTLLSDPHFVKSHLNHKKTQEEENLLIISRSFSIRIITDIKDETTSRELDLPRDSRELDRPRDIVGLLGSCNGLVLLKNRAKEMFLVVNPTTQQLVKIPCPYFDLEDTGTGESMYGFGYDSVTDDYKIVVLSYYCSSDSDAEEWDLSLHWYDTFVAVFSMKRGAWKQVQISPYNHTIIDHPLGAFVNGALHWPADRREPGDHHVIAAFRLNDETFGEIPYPPGVEMENFGNHQLDAVGGCLCLTNGERVDVNFWILKDYTRGYWIKLNTDIVGRHLNTLCFLGQEEIVVLSRQDGLLMFNHKENISRDMVVDGGTRCTHLYRGGCAFVESLVTPDLAAFEGVYPRRMSINFIM